MGNALIGVGTRALLSSTAHMRRLKQYALFLDEVRIPGLNDFRTQHPGDWLPNKQLDDWRDARRELEFLCANGFLTEYAAPEIDTPGLSEAERQIYQKSIDDFKKALEQAKKQSSAISEEFDSLMSEVAKQPGYHMYWLDEPENKEYADRLKDFWLERMDSYLEKDSLSVVMGTRLAAIALRFFERVDAVCIEDAWHTARATSSIDRTVTNCDLYEIIIKGLSIPDDAVPWNDVLSFRSETACRQQLLALRLWLADMSKGKLTYGEATDKIEYLKEEYRTHMKSAGVKAGTATLRTFVVGIAELVENTLKLKLKDLADAPFKLIDARADLVEAERKAVGRELAYIVRAERAFSAR